MNVIERDDFEVLSLEQEIVASAFWRLREPEDFGDTQARAAILYGFDHGHWSATEAFNALEARGLFGDVEAFMTVYAAGVRAVAEGRLDPFLPPIDIPSPAPSVRCAPSDEIPEVLANGRAA